MEKTINSLLPIHTQVLGWNVDLCWVKIHAKISFFWANFLRQQNLCFLLHFELFHCLSDDVGQEPHYTLAGRGLCVVIWDVRICIWGGSGVIFEKNLDHFRAKFVISTPVNMFRAKFGKKHPLLRENFGSTSVAQKFLKLVFFFLLSRKFFLPYFEKNFWN